MSPTGARLVASPEMDDEQSEPLLRAISSSLAEDPAIATHEISDDDSHSGANCASQDVTSSKPEPSPYVQSLSLEQRRTAERELVRKVDLRLLPMITLMYILNYLDRNNIAAARLAGLEEDLGLHGTQYQTAVSILFLGYLLMQVPSNLLLNKLGTPRIYLPVAMIVWGMVSTATACVQSFPGLVAVRFFLGFVEAPFFPGCLFFLSSWYTRKELGLRTAMLYSGSLISGVLSGLVAASIRENMDGLWGLRAWRWLFIIEGCVTIVVAFCAIFVLPNFPRTTDWLTPEEKQLAVWRLEEDIGEADRIDSKPQSLWYGLQLAVKDVKMWVMMLLLFCISASGSVNNFFPTVVATLGYGDITSLLLTAPPYALCFITAFANAWHADRSGERYLHVTGPLYVAMASFAIAAAATSTASRYAAMMLMVPGVFTGYAVALGWISNTMPRPAAKRAAALAAINAVSNTSSIYSSYLFPKDDGPRYVLAMSVCSAAAFVAICAATALRFILVHLNEKLDRGEFVEDAINDTHPLGDGILNEGVPGEAAKRGFKFLV